MVYYLIMSADNDCFGLLTLFMLHHDGVTQGQEFEELQYLRILLRTDTGNEEMVFELELLFGVFIPTEIHRLSKN